MNVLIKNEKAELSFLYEKTIHCPVCGAETKIKAVKKAAIRKDRIDTDLMPKYKGVNPLFYEIAHCVKCGYAALPTYFEEIRDYQKEKVIKSISSKWRRTALPEVYSVEEAIKQHKLALLNATVKEGKNSEKALLCLKLTWLYRICGDMENENRFQKEAIVEFQKAYENEKFPISGMDENDTLYLIGELYRRLGEEEKALMFFSQVLSSTTASSRVKEKVRNQRDLIRSKNKEINF